jgi:hypothetical protein
MNSRMLKISLMICLLLPVSVFSQKSNLGAWYMYWGNQKINDKLNFLNEVQYRNYNLGGDMEQLLFRTGLGYNVGKKSNILLGYAHIASESYTGATDKKVKSSENRIFQQLILNQQEGRFFISHRYRFEERFLGSVFKMRVRYNLSLNIPLNKAELTDKTLYFWAFNEIFINTLSPFFDRDRIGGGLGYFIHPGFKIEIGLMEQVQETKSRTQFQLNLVNTLPLQRKKE